MALVGYSDSEDEGKSEIKPSILINSTPTVDELRVF